MLELLVQEPGNPKHYVAQGLVLPPLSSRNPGGRHATVSSDGNQSSPERTGTQSHEKALILIQQSSYLFKVLSSSTASMVLIFAFKNLYLFMYVFEMHG